MEFVTDTCQPSQDERLYCYSHDSNMIVYQRRRLVDGDRRALLTVSLRGSWRETGEHNFQNKPSSDI